MKLSDTKLEAILYIAVGPIVLNVFMFLMYSRIGRLNLPCLHINNANAINYFDLSEAMSVGINAMLAVNITLYVIALVVLRTLRAAIVLSLSMVAAPCILAILVLLIMWRVLPNKDFKGNYLLNRPSHEAIIHGFSSNDSVLEEGYSVHNDDVVYPHDGYFDTELPKPDDIPPAWLIAAKSAVLPTGPLHTTAGRCASQNQAPGQARQRTLTW